MVKENIELSKEDCIFLLSALRKYAPAYVIALDESHQEKFKRIKEQKGMIPAGMREELQKEITEFGEYFHKLERKLILQRERQIECNN